MSEPTRWLDYNGRVLFVEIHSDVTINPLYVARIERLPDLASGAPGQTRVIMSDGTDYLVDMNYSLALQRICGIFR